MPRQSNSASSDILQLLARAAFSEALPSSEAFGRILGRLKLAGGQLMERMAKERPRTMA